MDRPGVIGSPTHRRLRSSGSRKYEEADLDKIIASMRSKQRDARKKITLLSHPLKTLGYFSLVLRGHFKWLVEFTLHRHRSTSAALAVVALIYTFLLNVNNPLQELVSSSWGLLSIAAWWIMLGFLSSFGLGTGLHTFVLYLGPFIASATLAATECSTTSIAKYGENKFLCVQKGTVMPTFFELWQLIALEAFLWGAGTAIGELPPYFVARAARLAGERLKEAGGGVGGDSDEEGDDEENDMREIEEITSGASSPLSSPSSPAPGRNGEQRIGRSSRKRGLFERAKRWVIGWLGHIGFFGILLFASIPNPLFDLAGLTCGHMLVPFATFFSATLIGKAVVKVNLQTFFIITVFSKDILEALVHFIDENIPFASGRARVMFDNMRKQYHRKQGEQTAAEIAAQNQGKGILVLWDLFLGVMIAYFIMSIINSSVQEYLVNQDEAEIELFRLEHEKTK